MRLTVRLTLICVITLFTFFTFTSCSSTKDSAQSQNEELAGGEGDAGDSLDEGADASDPLAENSNENEFESSTDSATDSGAANETQANSSKKTETTSPMADQADFGSSSSKGDGTRVRITGIDYKANQNGGTVVVQTSGPASYMTRKNSDKNQIILELSNAELPARFKRPFTTKEFSGPVGSINAYQSDGASTARIVIQMKNKSDLFVQQEGNSILLIPAGSAAAQQQLAESNQPPAAEAAGASETAAPPSVGENFATSEGGLAYQSASKPVPGQPLSGSIDDFMLGNLRFYGKPLSIQGNNLDIRDALSFIAEESGLNLVISEDVKGTVNLKLRKIPWDQALVVLLQIKQLGYVRQGNILRVAPLDKLRAEAESTKQTLESQRTLTPLRTRIFKLNHAKVADMEKNVGEFLTPNRGKKTRDERTNSLIVTDLDDVLSKVDELIRRLDKPTAQVLIEGKIIESQEDIERRIGVDWTSKTNGIDIGFLTGNPVSSKFTFTFPEELGDLSAVLGILEAEKKVRILSSPRIVALNNSDARIVQDMEFPTYSTTQAAGVAGGAPLTTKAITYKKANLVDLKVTPQVANDNSIRLDIDLKRDVIGPIDQTAPETGARPVSTRGAKSILLVKDGQTAVLAGSYQNESTDSESRLPILGQIPILGNLFKIDSLTETKSELMIFLTPKILVQ